MQSLVRTRLPIAWADQDGKGLDAEPATTEADLVARAVHDRHAFAVLYRRYLDPVYRYCYHRLGSKEAAEDATSQVFAKALAALPSYLGARPFRSWLFAIAHNVVVDAHRARRPDQSLESAAGVLAADPSPEDAALAAEGEQSVRMLLAQLSPDQARVVELRLAGLSEVEIAGILGRRPGAVRAVQFRALIRLRSLLGITPEAKGDCDVLA